MVTGAQRRAIADDSGRFQVPWSGGSHVEFDLLRMGYQRVHVAFDGLSDSVMTFRMTPTAQKLSQQVIAARGSPRLDRVGFYQRLMDSNNGMGRGYFLTEEDIDRRKAQRTSQLFENLPGLKTIRTSTADGCIAAQKNSNTHTCSSSQSQWTVVSSDGCGMSVYLDGVRLNDPNSVSSTRAPGGGTDFGTQAPVPDIDQIVLPGALAGVEIYPRSVSGPTRYQVMNGTCGLILLWTH
jgi:hypothetical protein